MSVQLPDSPTLEDLKSIEEYLKFHKESINKQKGIYQDKIEIAKGMFIFKHKQNQNKSDFKHSVQSLCKLNKQHFTSLDH